MIHPSYVDLMQVVNQGVEGGEEPIISSRYSIVMATARRARQLVAGDDPLVDRAAGRKALSVAVEELNENKIRILTDEEKAEMEARREEEARTAKEGGREESAGEIAEASAQETDGDAADEEAVSEDAGTAAKDDAETAENDAETSGEADQEAGEA